jgi:hypothetical protein
MIMFNFVRMFIILRVEIGLGPCIGFGLGE